MKWSATCHVFCYISGQINCQTICWKFYGVMGDENSCPNCFEILTFWLNFVVISRANFRLFARVFRYLIDDVFLGSKMMRNIDLLSILEV